MFEHGYDATLPMEELASILTSIDRALLLLDGDNSDYAMYCATQALAARHAIHTVHGGGTNLRDSDRQTGTEVVGETAAIDPAPVAVDHAQHVARDGHGRGASPASLLAAAERRLSALPGAWRNEIAICAAVSYLRRARRGLATS